MMRRPILAVLLVIFAVASNSAAQQQKQPRRPEPPESKQLVIPDMVSPPGGVPDDPLAYVEYPWVSGPAFSDDSGFVLDLELLARVIPDGIRQRIVANHEAAIRAANEGTPPPGRVIWTSRFGSYTAPAESEVYTLDRLVQTSEFVATATVEEVVGGISGIDPASMLRLRIDDWKGRDTSPKQAEILMSWPAGEIEIGYARVLAAMNGFPEVPQVGDRLIVFPQPNSTPEITEFYSMIGSRTGPIGAAIHLSSDGRVNVARLMAQRIPSILRSAHAAQLLDSFAAAATRSNLR